MRIAVMGAGAIGCYFGARLAKVGHDVTLIGREAHVEAMNRDGLCLDLGDTQDYLPVAAHTDPSAIAGSDLILFSVKSTDTVEAAEQIKPYLGESSVVLSLQNGVENVERLESILNHPVIPVLVYVATAMTAPGRVRYYGRGELVLGATDQSSEVLDVLSAAGIPTEISNNADGALWAKLIVNCAYNALSAIPHLPYCEMMKAPGVLNVMRSVVDECITVADACGVILPENIWDMVLKVSETVPDQYSSTAQDLERKKQTEIDYINGFIVRKAQEHGIPAPTNQALYTITKLCERSALKEHV